MLSEKKIREMIKELEDRFDPENDAYLDEGEQSELTTLHQVLEGKNSFSGYKFKNMKEIVDCIVEGAGVWKSCQDAILEGIRKKNKKGE